MVHSLTVTPSGCVRTGRRAQAPVWPWADLLVRDRGTSATPRRLLRWFAFRGSSGAGDEVPHAFLSLRIVEGIVQVLWSTSGGVMEKQALNAGGTFENRANESSPYPQSRVERRPNWLTHPERLSHCSEIGWIAAPGRCITAEAQGTSARRQEKPLTSATATTKNIPVINSPRIIGSFAHPRARPHFGKSRKLCLGTSEHRNKIPDQNKNVG